METTRQAKAAHTMSKPEPADMVIPIGTTFVTDKASRVLTDSDFFMMTVHMLAPMRSKMVPAIANIVDMKKVKLFLANPLLKNSNVSNNPASMQ